MSNRKRVSHCILLACVGALAALAVSAPLASAEVTPGIYGYGGVEITSGSGGGTCLSPDANAGGTDANVEGGSLYACTPVGSGSQTCSVSGTTTTCRVSFKAVVPDPAGWRFDHWTGVCTGTGTGCSAAISVKICDPDTKSCEFEEFEDTTAVAHFVDTRAPVASVTQAPAAGSTVFSGTVTQFLGFASSEESEGVGFTCALDGSAAGCGSPYQWSPIFDGVHEFCVRATDASGLTGPWACRTWDQEIPPSAGIYGEPPADGAGPTATFMYSSNKTSHPADGFTLSYLCRRDGEPFAVCPNGEKVYEGLELGEHSFDVEAVFHGTLESAGTQHISPPAKYSWTVTETCATNPTLRPSGGGGGSTEGGGSGGGGTTEGGGSGGGGTTEGGGSGGGGTTTEGGGSGGGTTEGGSGGTTTGGSSSSAGSTTTPGGSNPTPVGSTTPGGQVSPGGTTSAPATCRKGFKKKKVRAGRKKKAKTRCVKVKKKKHRR